MLQAPYEIPEKLRPKINSKIQKQQPKVLSPHKKLGFPLRISSVNVTISAVFADLLRFSEEILNEKLHFLCSLYKKSVPKKIAKFTTKCL